MKSALKMFK